MDFLLVKKPTITLKPHFFDQMLQYEDILKKKFGFNLSKDWHSPYFSLEDEVLANTYLNTLQKGRKSPRASIANEKTPPKKGSIQWHKKIKTVLPSSALQHSEIIKGTLTNKPFFTQEAMSESQTLKFAESTPDDDSKSVLTQKKPFKVILKSKSAKSFEDRGAESAATFDTPGTPNLSVSGHKTATSEIAGVFSSQAIPPRPATTGLDSDQKFIRRNNSLAKDIGGKDPEVLVRPFKVKDRPDNSVSRPATDAEPERAKTGKVIKSELDKIKDQLNIHYGNSKSMNGRIPVKSSKNPGDISVGSSGFGFNQERMPLNQLISTEEATSSKDIFKTTKKGPIKPTYKVGFAAPDPNKVSRQDAKRNMFNISHGSGSVGRSGRRGVQSADKQPEDKKKDIPAAHSTIRTIISTLDQRQTPVTSSQQKQKARPSNLF